MARKRSSNVREEINFQLRSCPGEARRGILLVAGRQMNCALGRSGIAARKREGDGSTPAGRWPLRAAFYRPDRIARPCTMLPVRPLRITDGWCDDPADRNYNRPVRLPYPASSERLWREDGLYDLVVMLGYNDVPRSRSRGSAIFMHSTQDGLAPTEGCVALPLRSLRCLLVWCGPGSRIEIVG